MVATSRVVLTFLTLVFASGGIGGAVFGLLFWVGSTKTQSALHEIEAGVAFLLATCSLIGLAVAVTGLGVLAWLADRRAAAEARGSW